MSVGRGKLATFILRYDSYRSGDPYDRCGRLAALIKAYRDTYAESGY